MGKMHVLRHVIFPRASCLSVGEALTYICIFEDSSCSHVASADYYAESINSQIGFWGKAVHITPILEMINGIFLVNTQISRKYFCYN